MPYDDELIDCKSHKVYPNLCVTHFEEDHQDHALIKCDVGLKESNLEFAKKMLEVDVNELLTKPKAFTGEETQEFVVEVILRKLRLRASEMAKEKG